MQRLDKILSEAGTGTRKELREMIRSGRVRADGQLVLRPDAKVDEKSCNICVDGVPVQKRRMLTLMLHKPAGVVTSTQDPLDRTVMELLPEPYRTQNPAPVGRLDKQTEGLLLLTNDGALAHHLISPRHRVDKVYYAEHDGQTTPADAAAFAAGLTLSDGTVCLPALLEPMGPGKSKITVQEGKYHQVRRMMASRGMTVRYLRRISEGGLALGDLPVGQCRELTAEETALLYSATCTTTYSRQLHAGKGIFLIFTRY